MNELDLFEKTMTVNEGPKQMSFEAGSKVKNTVTVKDLANELKVAESTVKNAISELRQVVGGVFDVIKKNSQGGYLLTYEQATAIKLKLRERNNLKDNTVVSQIGNDLEFFALLKKREEEQKILDAYRDRRIKELTEENAWQKQQIAELTPMADGYKMFLTSHGSFDMQKTSALLKDKDGHSPYGRNNLIKKLKTEGILQRNGIPYRDYIDRGLFEVRSSVHNGIPFQSTLVYPKGIDYLAKILGLIVDYEVA